MRIYNFNSLGKICLVNNKFKHKAFRCDIKESIVEFFQNFIDHILLNTKSVNSARCVDVISETKSFKLWQ